MDYTIRYSMKSPVHLSLDHAGIVFVVAILALLLIATPVFAAKDFGSGNFKSLVKKGSALYPAAVSEPLQIGGVKLPSGSTGVTGNSRITFDLMNDYGWFKDSYLDKASLNGTFRMSKTYSYGFIDLGNVPAVIYTNSW